MKQFFNTSCLSVIILFLTLSNSANVLCQETSPTTANNPSSTSGDSSDWQRYIDKLKTCSTGNFNLKNSVTGSSMVYQITGLKNNKCEVFIKIFNSGSSEPGLILNCQFEQNDRQTLVDEAEKMVNSKDVSTNVGGKSSQITSKSCAPVIDGAGMPGGSTKSP